MGALRRLTMDCDTVLVLALWAALPEADAWTRRSCMPCRSCPSAITALNQQLTAIQEGARSMPPPVSGSNIQPVQMMDLDGTAGRRRWPFSGRAMEKSP